MSDDGAPRRTAIAAIAPSPEPRPVSFDTGELVLRGDHHSASPLHGGSVPRHVLLLHGGGQTRHSWGSTAAELAAGGWHATTLDLRGHGESEWSTDGSYGLADLRGDITAVVETLGTPVTLIGASLGGLTSLSVAAHRPELVDALVLVDIVPRTLPEGVARIRAFMSAHQNGFATLEDAAQAIADYKHQPMTFDPVGLRNVVRHCEDGRWYWHWDPRVVGARRRDGVNSDAAADDLMRQACRISAPTLVVRGGSSDVVDDAGIDELLHEIPGSRSATVASAGHMIAGDANASFTAVVATFLADLDG